MRSCSRKKLVIKSQRKLTLKRLSLFWRKSETSSQATREEMIKRKMRTEMKSNQRESISLKKKRQRNQLTNREKRKMLIIKRELQETITTNRDPIRIKKSLRIRTNNKHYLYLFYIIITCFALTLYLYFLLLLLIIYLIYQFKFLDQTQRSIKMLYHFSIQTLNISMISYSLKHSPNYLKAN